MKSLKWINNKKLSKRRPGIFLNTALPFTSPRVSVILSHPDDSENMIEAIRAMRRTGEKREVKLSKETTQRLEKLSESGSL